MADSLGLKRACRSARGTGWIEGPAYCGPPIPCQTQRSFLWLWLPARACCSLLPLRVLPGLDEALLPAELGLLMLFPPPPWLLEPAARAVSESNWWALPEACAARPPSAAISRWRSLSMDAKPRPEPDWDGLRWLVLLLLPCGF